MSGFRFSKVKLHQFTVEYNDKYGSIDFVFVDRTKKLPRRAIGRFLPDDEPIQTVACLRLLADDIEKLHEPAQR